MIRSTDRGGIDSRYSSASEKGQESEYWKNVVSEVERVRYLFEELCAMDFFPTTVVNQSATRNPFAP